jgi:SAM-dependent methyltransferase
MTNNPRHDLIQSYNNHARERESDGLFDWKISERDRILNLFQQEKVQTLLEIGAGTGRDSLFFQEHDLRVTCIDLSPVNVALCREKGLNAKVMDMAHLDFPANAFDAVYAMNSLLHLPKVEMPQVLQQIRKVLKPNGIFYLGVYGGYDQEGIWEEDTYTPKRFFSFYSDKGLKKEVGKVVKVVEFNQIKFWSKRGLHFQSLVGRKG